MIETKNQASRKGLKEDRAATCPIYGCNTLERLKPLKLGIFGTDKYPICRIHKTPLVFVDEFIGDFLQSVNACLLDISLIPPKDLQKLIKEKYPDHFSSVFNKWMYSSSIGRGAKIVPEYLASLSRAYKNSLTKKQKKSMNNESNKKKREKLIILGFKKIEMEYIEFLKKLYDTDEMLYNKEELKTIPQKIKELIQGWLNEFLKNINIKNNHFIDKNSMRSKKIEYDKILQARTCMLLLGRSPSEIPVKISAFELFSAYRTFLDNGLCHEYVLDDSILNKNDENFQHLSNRITETNTINEVGRNSISNNNEYYGVIYLLIDNNRDQTQKYKMFYIGQTIQELKKRFYSHINYSTNKYLREAFRRYDKKLSFIKIDDRSLQTKGGEFTIKIIERCKDLEELNKFEKIFIKKYKACVLDYYFLGKDGKRKPLYGYNISRGGGGYPVITGEEHGSFIHIDQESLKNLIKRGFSAEEIAKEFEISIPTLINKIEYYWEHLGIEKLRDARNHFGGNEKFLERFGIAARSVTGIVLDIPKLIDFIEQGFFLSELEEQFKTSFSTITNHLQKIGYDNLTNARIRLGAMETFRKRWSQKKASSSLRGSDHQDYIYINKEELRNFIKLGNKVEEIADHFGVSRPTIISRLKEYWGINFNEAQRLFKVYPKLDKKLGIPIIPDIRSCSINEIDIIYLQSLIHSGFNMTQIASFYEKGLKSMREFMIKILDIDYTPSMYFQSAKDEIYWKPRIIKTIISDNNTSEIIKNLHSTSHFRELGRIWRKEYQELNQNNDLLLKYLKRFYLFYPIIDNQLLLDLLNKKKKSYEIDEKFKRKVGASRYNDSDYYDFLRRCIFVYDEIDNEFLNQLLTEQSSAGDIDIAFIKIILKSTFTMQEVAVKLQMGLIQARNFLRNLLKINYSKAVREYVWKPELSSYIKKYDSLSEIAKYEECNLSTLRNRFKTIWSIEVDKYGSLKKAYPNIKENLKKI